MYVSQLELEHFRGARTLQIDLHPKLNVFVGLNGSGKSTMLDACALALSWLVNRIQKENASGRPISEDDIHVDHKWARIHVTCNLEVPYRWQIVKSINGARKRAQVSELKAVSTLAHSIRQPLENDGASTDLPVIVYYPVDRAVRDIPLRVRKKANHQPLATYEEALSGGANFRTFFAWFREREDLENEARRFSDDANYQFPDPQLEAVREALIAFMPHIDGITIRRQPLRMEIRKNGQRLSVKHLSDGEKCLMAMIGDLARRMAIAHPNHAKPLEGHGVVMIDEIDLHLHPKWQQMVVSRLQEVFPNCQFLLSTHSPHVMTHVPPQTLHLLHLTSEDGLAVAPVNESYGKTVERILEDVMALTT